MYFAISMEFIIGISIMMNSWEPVSLKQNYKQDLIARNWISASLLMTFGITDSFIHIILLHCYLKGLFRCTQQCYSKEVDDQVHEGLVEITRYSVLFGQYVIVVIIMNVILAFAQLNYLYELMPSNAFKLNLLLLSCLCVRDIVSLMVLFLSFKFSYIWYKDYLCGRCDAKMRGYCESKVEQKTKEIALMSIN